MRAVVVEQPGGPEQLRLQEVPDPVPGERQVLVEVHATALNRADLLQRRGLYPPPPGETDILGLECAGVVAALGPGTTRVTPGDRVMALVAGGGYAERIAIHEDLLMAIPATMSFEEAAAVPEAFLTAREALFTLGDLLPRQVVLVHAAGGGVGTAAVQLAHRAGATVIGVASASKLEGVRALGAAHTVDRATEDFVETVLQASGGRGADVIVDFVGAPLWERHARCLADGGRHVVVGVLGGARATVDLGVVLRRRHRILGLVMRSRTLAEKVAITRAFVRESLPWFAEGRLRPVVARVYPWEQVADAHRELESNQTFGKLVLRVR